MRHLFRFICHSIVFLAVCLPLMLLGIIMVAIALLFVSDTEYKFPRIFKWWDNADVWIGRDSRAYQAICAQGKWARYQWLVFRNPMNYFDYQYLGLHWNGHEIYTHYNPKDDDVGDDGRAGFRYIEVVQPCPCGCEYFHTYYEYYWIYQYPFAKNVCFRYRLGWKIANNKNEKGTTSQWVFVISPWKSFK